MGKGRENEKCEGVNIQEKVIGIEVDLLVVEGLDTLLLSCLFYRVWVVVVRRLGGERGVGCGEERERETGGKERDTMTMMVPRQSRWNPQVGPIYVYTTIMSCDPFLYI